MKTIARKDLTTSLMNFPRTIDDLVNNIWGLAPQDEPRTWKPSVDIRETAEDYRIKVELPGIAPEDIDIQVTPDSLTIRGESKAEEKKEEENWHLTELVYGSFLRTISFPTAIRPDGVTAQSKDGILGLVVPKAVEHQSRKITIRKA